jgi:hypothetical protein
MSLWYPTVSILMALIFIWFCAAILFMLVWMFSAQITNTILYFKYVKIVVENLSQNHKMWFSSSTVFSIEFLRGLVCLLIGEMEIQYSEVSQLLVALVPWLQFYLWHHKRS